MGRPKLADLFCSTCNITFKKKSFFEEHMENHSYSVSKGRQTRLRSNWCHACRKGFEDDEYKLHIQEEHKFDLPKINISKLDDAHFPFDNGYVVVTKKKIKREVETPPRNELSENEGDFFNISLTDIKVEPSEKNTGVPSSCEVVPMKKNVLKVKTLKIKCTICGMRCKGERGLKIHMSAHKRARKNSIDASCSEDDDGEEEVHEEEQFSQTPKLNEINSPLNNNANPLLLSNNGVLNLGQNAQSGFVLNMSQLQNQPLGNILTIGNHTNNVLNIGNPPNNILNFGNQPNSVLNVGNQSTVQTSIIANQNNIQQPDGVLKFDCDSEKYMKWLKKFISKCKMHRYPLSPELLQSIKYVTEEIMDALANPAGNLKKKSNHFYFLRMSNLLSEISLGHLRYSLCVVMR